MKVQVPVELLRRMERHGEACYPYEGAGVLFGSLRDGIISVEDIMTMPNTFEEAHRHHRYMIDARRMMEAELAAEERDLEVIGIFHSHPDHPAQPSTYDLEHSLPWYTYIITSIQEGDARDSRAWRLQEDRQAFKELDLRIEYAEVEE